MSENISVYMVVNLTIHDHEEYRIYEKGFFSFLNKYRVTILINKNNKCAINIFISSADKKC